MKHVSLLLVAIVGVVWCVMATAAEPGSTKDDPSDAIRKMEQGWAAAAAKKDAGPLDEMLADDYTLTTPQGQLVGKSEFVDRVKDGTFALESADYSELKVRVYSDAAVVTGRLALKGKWGDSDVTGDYAFTDTFIRHDHKWQQVAGQVTRVEN